MPDIQDRYNIAPSAAVPVVRWGEKGRELALMQWGLVPAWADDPKIGTRMINARSETVAEKPSFRTAFKRRRCLVPTSGFYEWTGPDNARQPYFITFTETPMAFAGIWEIWERAEGYLETFSILTTHPNEKIAALHDRMPVVIRKEDFGHWLNPQMPAEPLFEPLPNMLIEYWPVDKRVGNPRNNDPRVLERVTVATQSELF